MSDAKTAGIAALAETVGDCIREEMVSIGAINEAIRGEKDPGYVVLLRDAKSQKQAAVEQLSTLFRMSGQNPPESALLLEEVKEVEARVAGFGRTSVLGALRTAEGKLVDRYRELLDAQTDEFDRSVASRVLERAIQRWHILTAHLAVLDADAEEAKRLPRPLSEYFASSEARVCMRCLFDRPGAHSTLRRHAPETYVCAGCHGEVLAAFPADLQTAVERCSIRRREALVIEKALSRPQRVLASRTVIAALSGLIGETPAARSKDYVEKTLPRKWAVDERPAKVAVPLTGASPSERTYLEVLFEPRRVSRNW